MLTAAEARRVALVNNSWYQIDLHLVKKYSILWQYFQIYYFSFDEIKDKLCKSDGGLLEDYIEFGSFAGNLPAK